MLSVVSSACSCSNIIKTGDDQLEPPATISFTVPVYTYNIINAFPHDSGAFTQGMVFAHGNLFEGTGLYGASSLRKVDLETGTVLQIHELVDRYFGEGITICEDTIVQLTWKSKLGFIYDKNRFGLLGNFSYATEGWGITYDGKHIIISDGTSILHFLDPRTFNKTGEIEVSDNDGPINGLNELEYVNGKIYANIWPTYKIAIIEPQKGRITGWIDLSGILPSQYCKSVDVLNGIAYDAENDRIFVTGKLWPWLFEIQLISQD
ncbi:glutaminyl-peptide cyclotransferase [Chloroflexota bacterium]